MKEDLKQEHEYLVLFARVILPNRDPSHKGLRKVEFFGKKEYRKREQERGVSRSGRKY
jgi:hypothetical protein